MASAAGTETGSVGLGGRLGAVLLMPRPPSRVAGWSVRARKTSSRVGWPREKSSMTIPAAASAEQGAGGVLGRAVLGAVAGDPARSPAPGRGPGAPGRPARREQDLLRLGALGRVAQPHVDGAGADRRLELAGVPSAITFAVVDHRDAVGELVGLVEVLRGQQHRRAVGDDGPDDVPHLVAAARVEAGGGLVEEQQVGRVDHGRRDVERAAACRRSSS